MKADPRRVVASLGMLGILTLLSACDPPGKPSLADDELAAPTDFKTIYAQNCSGCHGADGQKGPGRVLNNALYLKVSSKENIHSILVNGRRGTLMPAFAKSNGGPLTNQQIDTLVNGMETNWAKPFTATDVPSYDGAGFTGDADNGRKLFAKSCYACHAPGGVAGALIDPSYLSLSSNQNLRTSIIVGRPDFPGLPMPDYRTLKMGHALDNQDIADLVAFLASKRPATSPLNMAAVVQPAKE